MKTTPRRKRSTTSSKTAAPEERTAFVPRTVFQTVFQGVVPAIAAAAIAGCAQNTGPGDTGGITVAMIGFDAEAGRGDATDTTVPPDRPFSVADTGFGVADRGFGVADVGFDGGPPPPRDTGIIVLAMIGFEITDPAAGTPSDTRVAQERQTAPRARTARRSPRNARG